MGFKWRQYPRGYRFSIKEPIAKCAACGELFTWLPDNFDMQHRFNRMTHLYCGGRVEMITNRDWLNIARG